MGKEELKNKFVIHGTVEKFEPQQGQYGAWCKLEIAHHQSTIECSGNDIATEAIRSIVGDAASSTSKPIVEFVGRIKTWKSRTSEREFVQLQVTNARARE